MCKRVDPSSDAVSSSAEQVDHAHRWPAVGSITASRSARHAEMILSETVQSRSYINLAAYLASDADTLLADAAIPGHAVLRSIKQSQARHQRGRRQRTLETTSGRRPGFQGSTLAHLPRRHSKRQLRSATCRDVPVKVLARIVARVIGKAL